MPRPKRTKVAPDAPRLRAPKQSKSIAPVEVVSQPQHDEFNDLYDESDRDEQVDSMQYPQTNKRTGTGRGKGKENGKGKERVDELVQTPRRVSETRTLAREVGDDANSSMENLPMM